MDPRGVKKITEHMMYAGRTIIITEEDNTKLEWAAIPNGTLKVNPVNGFVSVKLEGETAWIPLILRLNASDDDEGTTLSDYGITDAVSISDSRLTDARTPLAHTHSAATSLMDGYMSAADKINLDKLTSSSDIRLHLIAPKADAESSFRTILEQKSITTVNYIVPACSSINVWLMRWNSTTSEWEKIDDVNITENYSHAISSVSLEVDDLLCVKINGTSSDVPWLTVEAA